MSAIDRRCRGGIDVDHGNSRVRPPRDRDPSALERSVRGCVLFWRKTRGGGVLLALQVAESESILYLKNYLSNRCEGTNFTTFSHAGEV